MSGRHRSCPTPDKVKYPTLRAALYASRNLPAGRMEARAYRCRKHWHLTSKARR